MKRLARALLSIIIYTLIVAAVMIGVPKVLTRQLGTSYPIAAITSGSMWPELKTGDVVLIKKIPREAMRGGDIVVWQNTKGFTIHRIVRLGDDTLVTKGDANFSEDAPVSYNDVIGRTVRWGEKPLRFPYLGYISVYAAKFRNKN